MSGHNIVIRNKDFMDKLNSISDEFFSMENYEDERYYAYHGEEAFDNGEYFCSDEALQEKLQNWEEHDGYPQEHWHNLYLKWYRKTLKFGHRLGIR